MNIQTRPKHRIFAGEFVPISKKDAGEINKVGKRASEWLKARGIPQRSYNGRFGR